MVKYKNTFTNSKNPPYKHAIAAYGNDLVDITLQTTYGDWQKNQPQCLLLGSHVEKVGQATIVLLCDMLFITKYCQIAAIREL